MKRKSDLNSESRALSPPPLKRKVESTTTNKAVSSFFTPTSQKTPERLVWRVVDDSLLIGKYAGSTDGEEDQVGRRKIAAFDFDSTLIQTSSGNVFGKDASDWRWWDPCVPARLKELYADGYLVNVVSNQAGISLKSDPKRVKSDQKRLTDFKTKVGYVFGQLDIPISIYAATSKDKYRKPRAGMWLELLDDFELDTAEGPDLATSFFVGDAAGRVARTGAKADHSSSDRDFAANVSINFKTPEEYFLSKGPEPFVRTFDPLQFLDQLDPQPGGHPSVVTSTPILKVNDLDIVLFCGSPGSGKSTFYWDWLEPLGYERVNQDTLKTRDRCLKVAGDYLSSKQSVAVDNTNADPDTRAKWIEIAKRHNVPIRCVIFETPPAACKHNDAVRALNEGLFNPEKRTILPGMAFSGFASRYREPKTEEGFQDIVRVPFVFRGDENQRKVWSKYWT